MAASFVVIFIGVLYSVMNLFNAQMSDVFGNYFATILIHTAGLAVIVPIALAKKARRNQAPLWMHIGGALGLVTVIASNFGIPYVGVTATLALTLIGQVVTSMLIDRFGWFNFPKIGFHWKKLVSLLLIIAGTTVMLLWP